MRVPFEVSPGIVSDDTPHATPGLWSDGNNVRFRFGRAEVIGGWETYHATALTGVCRTAFAWTNLYNQINVAFGTHTKLQVLFNDTLYDITPADLVDGEIDATEIGAAGYGAGGYGMGGYGIGQLEQQPRIWSFTTRGQSLIACPRQGTIYIWENDTSTVAAAITNAPSAVNCVLVPPNQRQIRAFGCTQVNGVYSPACIRGCSITDYTDWTPDSADNGFEVLIEGGEAIVSARTFADRDAIWTKTGAYLGTFVGSPTQKYRVDAIARDCGLAGPNAVAVYNRVAYWLTPDFRFYVWPFGGVPQELPCPILSDVQANIDRDQVFKVVASSVSRHGEIWWFYPDGRDDDENSRYVSYNIDEGVWSKGQIARTAAHDNAIIGYPLFVDVSGGTFLHEKGTDANGSALSWFIQSAPQYVDEAERNLLFRDIWPDIKDQEGNVSLTVKLRPYPQGTDVSKGPYTLAVGADKYDFLAQGRLASIRLSGSAAGTFMRLGKPSFDVVATGQR